MNEKILAIIPARGGSKGIIKKNIHPIAGKPLIYYTIEAARKSKYINITVVSTDDDEIFEIAKRNSTPIIKRPSELSTDDSPTIDVVLHVLLHCKIQNSLPDIVVLLQPTSPLRTATDINSALELFMKNDCDSVISVVQANHPPHWNMILEGEYLKPLMEQRFFTKRRQDLPITYIPNGAIYIARPKTLEDYHTFYCPKTIPYIMSIEKSIDINTTFDLYIAEEIMKKGEDLN